jgi:DNA-binding NarL/FixJ family response regulator
MAHEVSIIVADDHPIVRQGLRQAISADPKLKILAEAGDGDAALSLIAQLKPNIAVLDMDMPKLGGMEVAREIQKRRLPVEVVYLTIHGEEDLFHAAMDLNAKGYILKDTALTEIVQGLRAVAEGQYYVTPSLSAYLFHRRDRSKAFEASQPSLADLTDTEKRVLRLISRERSSKEIAAELFIHYRTVENHRNSICRKLGIHGPNALLKFALRHKADL